MKARLSLSFGLYPSIIAIFDDGQQLMKHVLRLKRAMVQGAWLGIVRTCYKLGPNFMVRVKMVDRQPAHPGRESLIEP